MHRVLASLVLAVLLTSSAAFQVSAAGPAASPPPVDPTTSDSIDATDRYIVLLRKGADTTAVVDKASKRDGLKADRKFSKAVHGFSAKLDPKQKSDLAADPNVVEIVPDEVIHMASQTVPTGVSRIFGKLNPIAKIDGVDQRVDADVAIVDTGISPTHPDLNVAGGYNCSTSDHTAWRDVEDHGTHVAGIVGALDNGFGVVGVAPGVRLWAVKILNDKGDGLISWYVCGLDWILAQRDPKDPSRPLFEAVNMSVTKAGSDDHNCGLTNHDLLHQAICRVVAGGITVVAAAANDSHNAAANIPASYDEVITVSALADTDGKPGGLGGNACFSWGGYDKDDTFADFSNYGADVDLIAPGKCIRSTIPGGYGTMSGTSMAAPAVTGAVALYKSSRPDATPAEVKEALRYLGNMNWKTSTDPDSIHEPLLDVSRLDNLGTFALQGSSTPKNVEAGTTALVPATITRSPTFFERVTFTPTSLPDGWTGAPGSSAFGWTGDTGSAAITIPAGTPLGTYQVGIEASNQGRTDTTMVPVQVVSDDPTAFAPKAIPQPGVPIGASNLPVLIQWPPATDPTSGIGGYQWEYSISGGAFHGTANLSGSTLSIVRNLSYNTSYRFRLRAKDAAGHWSPWVVGPIVRMGVLDDRSSSILRGGSWARLSSADSWARTLSSAATAGTTMSLTFTGRSVSFVAAKDPHRGFAQILIDGKAVGNVNLAAGSWHARIISYTKTFDTSGKHTITVKVIGTGTYRDVLVDAFVVGR